MERDEWDYESNRLEGEEDSEELEEEQEGKSRSKLFADELEQIKEFNRGRINYAEELASRGEMNSVRAYHFLQNELVDISEVEKMVLDKERKLLDEYEKIDHQLEAGEIDSFSAELKREQVIAKQLKIKHQLGLLSVGLTYKDLVSVSDEYSKLIEKASEE